MASPSSTPAPASASTSSSTSTPASVRPQRLLRISKACDFCHKRRIKCQDAPGETTGARCRNCAEFDIPCTYARPSRRGRSSPQPSRPSSSSASGATGPGSLAYLGQGSLESKAIIRQHQHTSFPTSHSTPTLPTHTEDGGHIATERLSPTWRAFAHTSTPTLKRLAAVYHETVFPIFPLFDPVRLQRRLDALEHVENRAFFCSVMAACALACARARDGALSSNAASSGSGAATSSVSAASSSMSAPIDMPPEIFYAAAEEALPKDILQCRDFDYLRALALLSIASIQDAKIAVMQKYIGHYFTLLAINNWHDESNWPPGLHATEIEERRRLYWSTYTLDVFTSIIWDGCIHFQESHAKVEYPTGLTELERDRLEQRRQQQQMNREKQQQQSQQSQSQQSSSSDDDMPNAEEASSSSPSWMIGWNFTTDLYRILEHNLNKLRSRSSKFNLLGESTTPGSFRVSSQDRVSELYSALPAVFKQIEPATGDIARDIFGFQAANIQATMALLEMVHLSLEVEVNTERKCSVVHNVLQTFHQVPRAYMRAISAPLIYHIGGIGVILGTVMEGPLSENAYRLVRDLLLSMAVLLESLETFLKRSAGTGQRLRKLVSRLEGYYISVRSRGSVEPPSSIGNGNGNGNGDRVKDRTNSVISSTSSSNSNTSNNSSSGALTPRATNNTAIATKIESPPLSRTFDHPPQPQSGSNGGYRIAPPVIPPDGNGHAGVSLVSGESNGVSFAQQQAQQAHLQQQHPHPHAHPHLYQQQLPPHQPHQPHQLQQSDHGFVQSSHGQAPAHPGALFDTQSQQQSQPQQHLPPNGGPGPPRHITQGPPGSVPITGPGAPGVPGGPVSWVTSATGPGLTSDVDMQFHVPDELLQDWTWPFAVSNNYLSF